MKWKKSLVFTLVLVVIAVSIHVYSDNPIRVENQYSTGFYPTFSRILRAIFGWLSVSFGDLLYGLVILWLGWKTMKGIKLLVKKKRPQLQPEYGGYRTSVAEKRLTTFLLGCAKLIRFFLIVYILFNLCWGINYNRVGIAEQIGLKMNKYSREDLKMINELLVAKVNLSKAASVSQQSQYPTKSQLFSKVRDAYVNAGKMYPFLQYHPTSLKPSIWSLAGNYLGFTGYYNPFTGEAQVNTLIPEFLQPYTSCHEVAHQLGYAKEMEANFVAFLAGTASSDTLIHYSVYLELFMYSNRNLFAVDSVFAKSYRAQLSPAVINDIREWKRFNKRYQNPVEPVIRWIYGKYLERNQQPQGVLSYDEVTAFLIAYYKKFGKL